jgi:hypothetical protein
MYRARSFAEIRGRSGERAMMDEVLGTAHIDNARAVHIAQLSRQTIIDSEAEHLGFGGYFIFETHDGHGSHGINVLGKVASLDAAFTLLDLWRTATGPHRI